MFEFNFNSFQLSGVHDLCGTQSHARRFNTALNLFNQAALRGRLYRLLAGASRRPRWLLDLNTVKAGLRISNAYYGGIRAVPIDRIVGSEGRAGEFDRAFHPVAERQRERWAAIALAYMSQAALPPVQLIQVGEQYFVRDGHHRISVAKLFHQTAIDAEVTVWEVGERAGTAAAPPNRDPAAVPA